MASRWPLFNLGFLGQRSRAHWHLSWGGHTCFTNISCFYHSSIFLLSCLKHIIMSNFGIHLFFNFSLISAEMMYGGAPKVLGAKCHRVRKMCSQTGAWTRDPSLSGWVLHRLSYLAVWHIISPMVTKSESWHLLYKRNMDNYFLWLISMFLFEANTVPLCQSW